MRHRRRVKHFSRKSGPRKALLRGLVCSLVDHERITTTVEKAKELRRHVEKAITLAKEDTIARRRLLMSRYPNDEVVAKLFKVLSPRFKTRPGGYTRIIKIGRRPGDTAEMAFIEFVDYDYTKKVTGADVEASAKPAKGKKSKKADAETVKVKAKSSSAKAAKLVAAKRKRVQKIQKKSRAEARA